jgi:hypothetical protein
MPPTLRRGGIKNYHFCQTFRRDTVITLLLNIVNSEILVSYSFNIVYDVYTHNGGVHVHRILIFIKYLIMTGS